MRPPARLAQWLLIAFLSSGTARAAPASPLDFPARAAALEASAYPASLVEAAALRRALGQPDLAAADTERFFARLTSDPRAAAAAGAFLNELTGPAAPAPAAREAALRRFLAVVSSPSARPALLAARVRAEILLADQLWDASCPLPPEQRSDAACIQRIDAKEELDVLSLAERKALLSRGFPPSTEPNACDDPPLFRYVVHRRTAAAREAQDLLRAALRRARVLSAPRLPLLAHARFLLAEPLFEAALARTPTAPLPYWVGDTPSDIRAERNQKKPLGAWLRARTCGPKLGPCEAPLYEAVAAGASPEESVAARARIMQLFFDLDDRLFHTPRPGRGRGWPTPAPAPAGVSKDWKQRYESAYLESWCSDVCQTVSNWHLAAQMALAQCVETSTRLTLTTPHARTCHSFLHRLGRAFDRSAPIREPDEILSLPTAQTPLLTHIEPGGLVR